MSDDDLRRVDRRERPNEFGAAGQGRVAVYQGEKPVAPEVLPPEKAMAPLAKANTVAKIQKGWGLTRREAAFMLAWTGSSTAVEAWRKAFPKDKASPTNQRAKAARARRAIIAKIGEDEMFEVMGIGQMAVMEKLRQLKDAKMVKVFIDPKTASVIESQEYNDNTTQMNATKVLAQVHKMIDGDRNGIGGQVIVNVVQYAPQGAPPWPGGGRS